MAWKTKLIQIWRDRRPPTYTEFYVRQQRLAYEVAFNQLNNQMNANDMMMTPIPHPRDWIIKSRNLAWCGWDPFQHIYHPQPLVFGENPDFRLAEHNVIKEISSGAVDIIKSMKNIFDWGEKLGLDNQGFEMIWLEFVNIHLPDSLSAITRYSGD